MLGILMDRNCPSPLPTSISTSTETAGGGQTISMLRYVHGIFNNLTTISTLLVYGDLLPTNQNGALKCLAEANACHTHGRGTTELV
jgi:hypothetical protein